MHLGKGRGREKEREGGRERHSYKTVMSNVPQLTTLLYVMPDLNI